MFNSFYWHIQNFSQYNFIKKNKQKNNYKTFILKKNKNNNNIFFFLLNLRNKENPRLSLYNTLNLLNSLYLSNLYNIKLSEKSFNIINLLPKKITNDILFLSRKTSYKRFQIKYFNEILVLFISNI